MIQIERTTFKINLDVYVDGELLQEAEDMIAWLLYNHAHVIRETQALGTHLVIVQDLSEVFESLEALD